MPFCPSSLFYSVFFFVLINLNCYYWFGCWWKAGITLFWFSNDCYGSPSDELIIFIFYSISVLIVGSSLSITYLLCSSWWPLLKVKSFGLWCWLEEWFEIRCCWLFTYLFLSLYLIELTLFPTDSIYSAPCSSSIYLLISLLD